MLFDFLPGEFWQIDSLRVTQQNGLARVDMIGWAFFDPNLGPDSPGKFLLNGAPFDEIRYPILRGDVEERFWQRKHSRYSGYRSAPSGGPTGQTVFRARTISSLS
ncbi:MAG TPA: hypothetical protein VK493_16995 [Bryobacteraceae bacterium]|nr:hypothetical protein [Bryobacteraceae bacterium]